MKDTKIKCVVWDLDNTLWDGILLESEDVVLKDDVVEVIKELDKRGILQSISSKNDYDAAKKKLEEFDLWDYFIYPQINWNPKSEAIEVITNSINIGINTLAFVDDQEFERDEVSFSHQDVLCIDTLDSGKILSMDCMMPKFITSDSKNRRAMYQNDIARNSIEKDFKGTKEEFLGSLNMTFYISKAQESDLQRVEELTVRTHQLNSTGYVYSYAELKACIEDEKYEVFVTRLDDKYGTYGTIGLALVEKNEEVWEVKLLIMSCRVMSRGVGNILLNYICNEAKKAAVKLQAQFVPTDKNRIMYITYKFNGFKEIKKDNLIVFEADMAHERKIPKYVELVVV
ncbi:HAD-IIIC family phosphatase [Anaerocolumna sp.]|uniref:HAD-IIIC family phosphatase n=1 Tax=Anaerocolumna sp. TaxID=2041569 RepID=UPI0028A634F2|nr:HAD-IIIC family phosphatase [Anaerocolumna sp.]